MRGGILIADAICFQQGRLFFWKVRDAFVHIAVEHRTKVQNSEGEVHTDCSIFDACLQYRYETLKFMIS